MVSTSVATLAGSALSPPVAHQAATESAAPLRMEVPSRSNSAHAGVRREWHERPARFAVDIRAHPPRQGNDRPPFGRVIRRRGERGDPDQSLDIHAGGGKELRRLTIPQSDCSGFVEQERVHVAGRLDRTAGHCQDVLLHEPIDAGDADRRQKRANGGGDQTDQECDQHCHAHRGAREHRKRLERDHGEHENDGQPRQEDVQGNLIGGLLA